MDDYYPNLKVNKSTQITLLQYALNTKYKHTNSDIFILLKHSTAEYILIYLALHV